LAKRVRGQRSTHRPGGVGPARPDRDLTATRRPTSSNTMASTSAVTAPGEATSDATPIGGRVVTTSTARSASGVSRDIRARTRLRSGGLEQKAAAEAGWVADDLRRIAVISAIMLAGLAIAWVLLVVVGLGDVY
jgi:hypothetical protein